MYPIKHFTIKKKTKTELHASIQKWYVKYYYNHVKICIQKTDQMKINNNVCYGIVGDFPF